MLRYRLIAGPIMIALLIGIIWLDNWIDRINLNGTALQAVFLGRDHLPAGLLLAGMLLLLALMTLHEMSRLFQAKGVVLDRLTFYLAAIGGLMLVYLIPSTLDSQTTIAIYGSGMVLSFVATLIRFAWRHRTQGAILAGSASMFVFIYLGVLPGFYLAIRSEHSSWVIAAIVLVTKSCDIGAYFTGRAIGRHKLIPWLSPGKTWEGLIGGMLFSGLVAAGLAAAGNGWEVVGASGPSREFEPTPIPLWFAAVCGVILGGVGQLGDLGASLMKRDAGVKDSGAMIPGFGGFLDVLDSLILVAPLAYWMLAVVRAL